MVKIIITLSKIVKDFSLKDVNENNPRKYHLSLKESYNIVSLNKADLIKTQLTLLLCN